VSIAPQNSGFEGNYSRNVVNRLTIGGANRIQIEQSFPARGRYWQAIADAVVNVYNSKL
jgi:hypothetical protein